jgi:hypothetical protein
LIICVVDAGNRGQIYNKYWFSNWIIILFTLKRYIFCISFLFEKQMHIFRHPLFTQKILFCFSICQ